jgi:hypothetical protein
MSVIYWPPGVPNVPQKGYTEDRGVNLVVTPMDAGPAKVRKRSNKPAVLNMSFIMTTAQLATLDDWIINTINYVSRFKFTHPRTNQSVDCRFMPQSSGNVYTTNYLAPGYYTISVQLEVMP